MTDRDSTDRDSTDRNSTDREAAFDRLVHQVYETIERGETVHRTQFISQHPDFQEELGSFFADMSHLKEAAGEAGCPAPEAFPMEPLGPTVAGDTSAKEPGLGTNIQYVGDYKIVREIARGGMGVVFVARQENLRRTVALKMILAGRFATSAEVERFRREARAAARLKHPGIVGVLEVGEHENHHYFTMDYIEGCSLADRLREGSIAPLDAARLIASVSRAIQYAHHRGVLHRDLKPANVLLDSAGQPHVTDFGLSKPLPDSTHDTIDEITRSGQIVGTPSYMAPEQAAAKHQLVGVASDIYSLGAILYACVSGRAPFIAESTVETLRQVIEREPTPVRWLNPGVPKDLENIALKCLSKEPHRRYATADELADDLDRFLEGRPVRARPVSAMVRLWRMTKRNPGSAAALVLLFALAIGAPPIAFHQYEQSRQLANNATEINKLLSAKANEVVRARTAEQQADAKASENRHLLYIADMQRMSPLFDQANILGMRERLERHVPEAGERDLRDFEWYYWRQQCNQQRLELAAPGPIEQLALSPSGRWMATRIRPADGTEIVEIRDTESGLLENTIPLSPIDNGNLRFQTEDALTVISGGRRAVARSLDWRTGKSNAELPLHFGQGTSAPPARFAISPTGRLIATSMMGSVRCYNIDTAEGLRIKWSDDGKGNQATSQSRPPGQVIRSGPDGRYVDFVGKVAGSTRYRTGRQVMQASPRLGDRTPAVWDARDIFAPSKERDGGPVFALRFSPSEQYLAAGSREGRIKLWDLNSGEETFDLAVHRGTIWDLAFSPDGDRVVTVGDDGYLKIWELPTGRLIAELAGQLDSIRSVDYRHGGYVATGGVDQRVRLWRLPIAEPIATFHGHDRTVTSVRFSPDGRAIWSSGLDGRVMQWPVVENRHQRVVVADAVPLACADISVDHRHAAAGSFSGEVTVWDVSTGRVRNILRDAAAPVFHVHLDGQRLRAFDWEGVLWTWDLETEQLIDKQSYPVRLRSNPMLHVALSPNGEQLAGIDDQGRLRIFSTVDSDAEAAELQPATKFAAIKFDPAGKELLVKSLTPATEPVSADQVTMRLWNVDSGEPVADVARGPTRHDPAFSQNGKYIAFVQSSSGTTEGTASSDEIVIWDRMTKQESTRLTQQGAGSLALSPTATHVAVVISPTRAEGNLTQPDSKSYVCVRRVEDGDEICRLPVAAKSVSFVSDRSLVLTYAKGGMAIWDIESGDAIVTLVRPAGRLTSVAYSNDGSKVVASHFPARKTPSGLGYTGHTIVSRSDLLAQEQSLTSQTIHGGSRSAMAYLPDGSLLQRGLAWTRCQIEPAVRESRKLSNHSNLLPEAVAQSANACFFLAPDQTLCRSSFSGDASTVFHPKALPDKVFCSAITATSDARRVALAFDNQIHIFHGTTLEILHKLEIAGGEIHTLAFSPDGKWLASGGTDRTVRIWDATTGNMQTSVWEHAERIHCVRFSPGGKTVVSACGDGMMYLSDVITCELKTSLKAHQGPVYAVEFSPVGNELASVGEDGAICFWRAGSDEI